MSRRLQSWVADAITWAAVLCAASGFGLLLAELSGH